MGLLSSIGKVLVGSPPKTKLKTPATKTPGQQRLLDALTSGGLGQARQEFARVTPNLAELSPQEQQSLAAFTDLIRQSQEAGTSAEDALRRLINEDPTQFEEFFRTAITAPALDQLQNQILPQIAAESAARGQTFSGIRGGIEEAAVGDLINSLTQQRAELGFKTQEANKNRALTAAQALPGVSRTQAETLQGAAKVGGIPRAAAGTEEERRNMMLKTLLAIINQQPFENVLLQKGGSSGLLTSALQGAGQAAGQVGGAKLGEILF